VFLSAGQKNRLSQWVTALAALVNKTLCIAWAMLGHGTDYVLDYMAV